MSAQNYQTFGQIFDITEGLVRRNYTAIQIRLILGGNFQRALGEIWSSTQAAPPQVTTAPGA